MRIGRIYESAAIGVPRSTDGAYQGDYPGLDCRRERWHRLLRQAGVLMGIGVCALATVIEASSSVTARVIHCTETAYSTAENTELVHKRDKANDIYLIASIIG